MTTGAQARDSALVAVAAHASTQWKAMTGTCLICAKPFPLLPYEQRRGRRFCSTNCYHAWKKGSEVRRKPYTLECQWCHHLFYPKNTGQKYCCAKCNLRANHLNAMKNRLCEWCRKPLKENEIRHCAEHMRAKNDREHARIEEIRARGICIYCEKYPAIKGQSGCIECASKRTISLERNLSPFEADPYSLLNIVPSSIHQTSIGMCDDCENHSDLLQDGLCPECYKKLEAKIFGMKAIADYHASIYKGDHRATANTAGKRSYVDQRTIEMLKAEGGTRAWAVHGRTKRTRRGLEVHT